MSLLQGVSCFCLSNCCECKLATQVGAVALKLSRLQSISASVLQSTLNVRRAAVWFIEGLQFSETMQLQALTCLSAAPVC